MPEGKYGYVDKLTISCSDRGRDVGVQRGEVQPGLVVLLLPRVGHQGHAVRLQRGTRR